MTSDRSWAAALRAACEHPEAAAMTWRAAGGQVVGLLGWSAPRELVTAAGMLPVRLSPDRLAAVTGRGSGGASRAGAVEPRAVGPDAVGPGAVEHGAVEAGAAAFGRELAPGTARLAAALLSGALDWIDFLVIGRDREDYTKLFYLLRELRRGGAAPGLVPVAFFDLLRLPSRTSARYNRQRAAQLVEVLAGWAGRPVTPADLAAAVEAATGTAHTFGGIQALRARRPQPGITGTGALAAAIAARVLPAAELRPLLDAALTAGAPGTADSALGMAAGALGTAGSAAHLDVRSRPLPVATVGGDAGTRGSGMSRAGAHDIPEISPYGNAGRVFLAGSGVDDLAAYEALEALGLAVVGEDHEWGDDGSEYPRATRDPLDGIVDRYHFAHGGVARAGLADRVGGTADRVRAAGPDGVLYLLGPYDEAAGWHLPALREALGGLPLVPVRLHDPASAGPGPADGGSWPELRAAGRRLRAELGAAGAAGGTGRAATGSGAEAGRG